MKTPAGPRQMPTLPRPSQTQTGTAGKTTGNRPHDPGRVAGRGCPEERPTCKKPPSGAQGTCVPTNTHTQADGDRKRERRKHREGRERETRETPKWAQRPTHRHTHTHTHIDTHRHTHTPQRHRDIQQVTPTPRQPLKLPGFAFRHCDPAVREQPTGTQADLSSRSLGHHFWGDSLAQRPRTPEAGIPRCLPAIRLTFLPPEVSSCCSTLRESRPPETILVRPWPGMVSAPTGTHDHTGLLLRQVSGTHPGATVAVTVTESAARASRMRTGSAHCSLAAESQAADPLKHGGDAAAAGTDPPVAVAVAAVAAAIAAHPEAEGGKRTARGACGRLGSDP
nr:uncharacterized protein LOC123570202 [Macaca fascicularis]